jgi:FYVE/RhoGEF/PH domain-containing protein 5/6
VECLEREKKNSGGLDLDSLLITPVQRIPRYKLLLKELVKHTSDSHPDKKNLNDALQKMTEIANIVNDSMKNNQSAKIYDYLLETVKGLGVRLMVLCHLIIQAIP